MSAVDILWDFANPFVMDIQVEAHETDRLGHTNNQVYLKWMEEISWLHIEPEGLPWSLQEKLGKSMAITRTEIDYVAASYVGDELRLATWVTHCDGRLTSTRHFQLVRISDGKTMARANSRYACIDLQSGKPARMPKEIASVLSKLSIETCLVKDS